MNRLQNKQDALLDIPYEDNGIKFNGKITSNTEKKLPGVLLLPAWLGIDEEAKNAALALERKGYIAFIADIYGEGNIPHNREEASVKSSYFKQNFQEYQTRIHTALNTLISNGADKDKIAVIGYCFGGAGALEAARGNLSVKGVVCIHGSLYKNPSRKNTPIHTKILVEHPDQDRTVTKEDFEHFVLEMNECKADWQIITYAHAKHTFTNPQSPDFNPIMAKRAWQHTLLFLKEVLNEEL